MSSNFLRLLRLAAGYVLLVAGTTAGAAQQQLGSGPLRVTCDDDATIGVERPSDTPPSPQYYAMRAKGSVLFLDGTNGVLHWGNGTSTFALYDDPQTGRFSAVSSLLNGYTIETVVRAGDTGVELRQTLSYQDGRSYYDIRWEIVNMGERSFRDVRFCHGGDVSPYGEDFVPGGGWDTSSNLVFVLAHDGRMMGLRGMSPSPDSHYEDHFQLVREACKAGGLPGTVNNSEHDAAYALQWNREILGPEETWTILAREMWTGVDIPEDEAVWTNVTAALAMPLFTWELNRQTGTYFGELTLRNAASEGGVYCTGPFWCVLNSSEIQRYWPQASGTDPGGMEYTNLTAQVEGALGDGRLDPGDEVVMPGIQVYMRYRQPPPDSAFTIWATMHDRPNR